MAQNCYNDPKWPCDPKNGLHWTAENWTAENWTKHSLSYLKFIIFVNLERKNEFHGNHAKYSLHSKVNHVTLKSRFVRFEIRISLIQSISYAQINYFIISKQAGIRNSIFFHKTHLISLFGRFSRRMILSDNICHRRCTLASELVTWLTPLSKAFWDIFRSTPYMTHILLGPKENRIMLALSNRLNELKFSKINAELLTFPRFWLIQMG